MCDWQLDQAWYLRRSMVVRWYIVQMLEGNNSDGHAAKELNLLSLDTDGRAEPGHRELNDTYTDIP